MATVDHLPCVLLIVVLSSCIAIMMMCMRHPAGTHRMERNQNDRATRSEQIDHPVYGAIQIFHIPDLISDRVRGGGVWEEEIVREMMRWYRPKTDICDVGANLGLNALLLHRRLPGGITGCVHCFEPQSDVFSMLAFNMSHLPDVKLYNFALGASPSVVRFEQFNGNVGATVMHATAGNGTSGRTTTCDRLLSDTRRVFAARQPPIHRTDLPHESGRGIDGTRLPARGGRNSRPIPADTRDGSLSASNECSDGHTASARLRATH